MPRRTQCNPTSISQHFRIDLRHRRALEDVSAVSKQDFSSILNSAFALFLWTEHRGIARTHGVTADASEHRA